MYSSREVSELVGLSTAQVRRFARTGFLSPERTTQNHYRFSFQDLTFLKTTTALFAGKFSRQFVYRALRELHRQQPVNRPLSEIHLSANETGILAHDGDATWYPMSGQFVFDFETAANSTPVSRLDGGTLQDGLPVADEMKAEAWFDRGCMLEASRPVEARQAYRRTLALDPSHAHARVNLGRLLHAAGQIAEAIEHYRIVLTAHPDNALAAYNLGVALEDEAREQDAFTAYAQAIACDPHCAEAHFNIAKLYEGAGDQLAALRHLRTYKELMGRL